MGGGGLMVVYLCLFCSFSGKCHFFAIVAVLLVCFVIVLCLAVRDSFNFVSDRDIVNKEFSFVQSAVMIANENVN